MPDIKGTTRAQTIFLRSFRKEPFGPGAEHWPSVAVLRKWMRKPGFLAAMKSVREALRYQADFQLLSAAASAAHVLHTTVSAGDHEMQQAQLKGMSGLLKLAHLRERFAPPETKATPRDGQVMDFLRSVHPNAPVEAVLEAIAQWNGGPITRYHEDEPLREPRDNKTD